jgi:putative transposase
MARRKPPVIADQLLDQLLAGADAKAAFEKNGLLDELKKALAERVLNAEIDHHLETGEADGRVNSRNGYGKCPPGDAQRQGGSDRDREDRP